LTRLRTDAVRDDPGGETLTPQHLDPRYILVVGLGLVSVILSILALTTREVVLVPAGIAGSSVSMLMVTSELPAHRLRSVARVLLTLGIALALASILLMVVWD
jgi:hypothetical protein